MTESSHTAALLAQLSRDVAGSSRGDDVQVVVERAAEVVGPCEHGSMTLRETRGRLRTVAATSGVARQADSLQYDLGGPCVDAAVRDEVYLLDDVDTDVRWPAWSKRIAALGLGAVLSVRLGTFESQHASLNLYATRRGAFTVDDIDLATSYAALAGNALDASREIHDLRAGLTSRHLIGVAQGVLMSRYDLSLEQAFALLQRCSSTTNTKLRLVAAYVARHKQLPAEGTDLSESGPEDAGA